MRDSRSRLPHLFLLLAWALPAHSEPPTATLELSRRDYDARETTPGGFVLNHEQGDLPGIAIAMAADGSAGRWTAQVAYEKGDVTYRGFTQFGIPVRTTTSIGLTRWALRFAPAWEPALGPVTLRSHAELMYREIDRAIQRSPRSLPLTEKLDAMDLRGGLLAQLPFARHWSLQAEGELAWPLAQRLKVDSFGYYDKFVLEPGKRVAGRIGLGVTRQWSPHWRTGLWVVREYWRFGESGFRDVTRSGAVVGSATYPGSRQQLDGASLRIEYLY